MPLHLCSIETSSLKGDPEYYLILLITKFSHCIKHFLGVFHINFPGVLQMNINKAPYLIPRT